uniref:transposase n=1 Tax=Corallococcus coralloides TaxID=184914 RepID=UPI000FFF45F2|nr:transposase [Corallococcus coralloides]
MTSQEEAASGLAKQTSRRRVARDATPRFKAAEREVLAAAERMVPREHLARKVRKLVKRFDLTRMEAGSSALGQRGYAPREVLALWVYASLIGIHQGTQLAHALQTDMALRLLSAGHAISRSVLNRFRASQGPFFTEALEETVRWASQEGLVEEQALAVDSVRLRAHASGRQVRVRKHSLKRLEALAQVDVRALSEPAQKHHDDEVQRHQQAVLLCQQRAAATVVLSNPCAGLMQFPGNGVHPGHRVTVVSSGVRQRLVVGVLLSASGNDKGHLARALQEARRVLRQAGLPASARLQVAADAGYWSEEDLRFAALNRDWVDVLLKESSPTGPLANEPGMLRREAFEFQPSTRAVVCPAGRTMQGPVRNDFDSCEVYSGVGCADCPQRARCTRGPYRKLTVRWDYERFRQAMRQRMSQPGAVARYNQRIATVEPVFASLEHDMRFRRLSSRHPPTVRAEVLLKLLAHNIRRLLTCSRLFCVRIVLDAPASLVAWQPASWPRYSAQTSSRTGFHRMGPANLSDCRTGFSPPGPGGRPPGWQ